MTLNDINKGSERFFDNYWDDKGGNNPAVSHGTVVMSRDFSSPRLGRV